MENTVVYDIYLVDQDGNRVKLPYACTLCIPYPDGLNQNSQSAYHINILHEMDGGKSEDFDSVSGGLELKQQGLCVQVSSLSPFTITWERLPEADLPQTGDNGHPGLWLALMLASAGNPPAGQENSVMPAHPWKGCSSYQFVDRFEDGLGNNGRHRPESAGPNDIKSTMVYLRVLSFHPELILSCAT